MKKRGKHKAVLSPEDVRRALIVKGQLIPQTEEEVRLFEESVDVDGVALPDNLSDPFAILSRGDAEEGEDAQVIPLRQVATDPAIGDQLARAARAGKAIPPDVEERMRQDRDAAEGDDDDEQ